MGREVRMVNPYWLHPVEWKLDYHTSQPILQFRPLQSDYLAAASDWDEGAVKWDEGLIWDYFNYPTKAWKPKQGHEPYSYTSWAGPRPVEDNYMPVFPKGTATCLCMYENTTEGTPISPAFATAEELARWLVDNSISAGGGWPGSFDYWMDIIARTRIPALAPTTTKEPTMPYPDGFHSRASGLYPTPEELFDEEAEELRLAHNRSIAAEAATHARVCLHGLLALAEWEGPAPGVEVLAELVTTLRLALAVLDEPQSCP